MEYLDILSYQQEDFCRRISAGYFLSTKGDNLFREIVHIPPIIINQFAEYCHGLTSEEKSLNTDINYFNYYFYQKVIDYCISDLYDDLLILDADNNAFSQGNYQLFLLKDNPKVKIMVNLIHLPTLTSDDSPLEENDTCNSSVLSKFSLNSSIINSLIWDFSLEQINDSQVIICFISPDYLKNVSDTIPEDVYVIFAGFLPTNLVYSEKTNKNFSLNIKNLFYCGALKGYLYSFLYSESYHLNLAKEASNHGNYLGAISHYNKALNLNFHNTKTHLLRAIARWKIGDKQGALADCDEAVRIEPEYHLAYHWRGYISFKIGDLQSALDNYSEEIRLNPYSTYAYYRRGFTHEKLHNLFNAFDDYSQVILLNKNLYQAFYNRGNIRYELGDIEGAISDFDQALKLNPCLSQCYYNRGIIYTELGEIEQGIRDYESAIKLNPHYEKAYYNLAVLFEELGEEKKALNWYDRTLSINPNFYQAKANKEFLLQRIEKEIPVESTKINLAQKQKKVIVSQEIEKKFRQKPREKSEDLFPENYQNIVRNIMNKDIPLTSNKNRKNAEQKFIDPWDTKKFF